MKTIVFIGTQKSGSSREAIKAASRLGYFTVLLTDNPAHLEKRTDFPEVHLMRLCDLKSYRKLKEAVDGLIARGLNICTIISFIDPHCQTASLLAEEYGINRFSTRAIARMYNKILSREALVNTPYSPNFKIFHKVSDLCENGPGINLPAVLKSPYSTGSKDVIKAEDFEAFRLALIQLTDKYPNKPVLAEEYLDGPQYLVETLTYRGNVRIVAVIEQEISFFERFIVTGYNLMLDIPPAFYANLRAAVEAIIKSHGMENGPCHLEMRLVNGEWKVVEVNPRISGGGMNRLIEIGLGINLVEETLKMALGQSFNLYPRHKVHTFAQYVTVSETGILERVTGKCKAYKCPGVKEVYIKPRKGALLSPPLSMGNRYAYVIATGDTEGQARENAKYAASQIQFTLKTDLNK